jgi:hypothetical protein
MHISKWLGIIAASLLLVACGGDDTASSTTDNSQSDTPSTTETTETTETTTTITAQNSVTVARFTFKQLFSTLDGGNSLADVSTEIGSGFDIAGGVDIDDDFNLVAHAKRQLEKRMGRAEMSGISTIATGIVYNDNGSCPNGGTFDDMWDDHDNDDVFSVGDTSTTTDYNCVEEGETTNGKYSITLLEDEPNFSVAFVFTDFTATDSEETVTFNGDLTIIVKESELDFTESISGNAFHFSDSESDITINNFTMTVTGTETSESFEMTADSMTIVESESTDSAKNLSLTFTEDRNTSLSTMVINGTFEISELEENVSLETIQAFEDLDSDEFPYTGVLKIMATEDNSSVTLTVLDAVKVRLEVDENGDGAVDQTSEITWTSLDI